MNVCVPFHELVGLLCYRARFGHPPTDWVPDLKSDEWHTLRAGLAEAVREPEAFDALFVLYLRLPDPDEPDPLPADLVHRALGAELLDVTDAELVRLLTTPVWVAELRDAYVAEPVPTGAPKFPQPQPGEQVPTELPDPEAVRADLLHRALARAAELLPLAHREPQPGEPEPATARAQPIKPPSRVPNSPGFTQFARDPAQKGDLLRRIELGLPILIRALGLERDTPDVAPLLAYLGKRFPITGEQRFRDEFRGFVADYATERELDWRTDAITAEVIAEMAEMAAVRTVLELARVEAQKAGSFPWALPRVAHLQQARRVVHVRQEAARLPAGSVERRFVERILLDAESTRHQYSKDYDLVTPA